MKKLFDSVDDNIKNEIIMKSISVISHETQTDLIAIQAKLMELSKKYNIDESDISDTLLPIKSIYFYNNMLYMNFMQKDEMWDEMFPLGVVDVINAINGAINEFPLRDNQLKKISVSIKDSFNLLINRKLFYHVIQNILKNALFFSSSNSENKVTFSTDVSNKNFNRIIISNNGNEIDKNDERSIFEAYTTTRVNGFGTGLSSVKNMLNYMHADIKVVGREACSKEDSDKKEKFDNVNFIISFDKKI